MSVRSSNEEENSLQWQQLMMVVNLHVHTQIQTEENLGNKTDINVVIRQEVR